MKEEIQVKYTHPYGAHEIIELHEVLNGALNAIHTMQLYAAHVADDELRQLLNHQMSFMQQAYNSMVHTVQGLGAGESLPYRPRRQQAASYGMPQPHASISQHAYAHAAQVDDSDVAAALLGIHKASAKTKMSAALEASHPQIRDMLLQGAVNCSHQAYEVWKYMERKGYYPLAVLSEGTNAQLMRAYQPLTPTVPDSVPPSAPAPSRPMETGSISEQLARGTQTYPAQQPVSEPTPVNASHLFSSPAYREQLNPSLENTSMIADGLHTEGTDTMGTLTHQAETKQPRGRKKSVSPDMELGQ